MATAALPSPDSSRLSHARASVQSPSTVRTETPQVFGDFRARHAREEPQRHDLSRARIDRLETRQRRLERQEILDRHRAGRGGLQQIVQRHAAARRRRACRASDDGHDRRAAGASPARRAPGRACGPAIDAALVLQPQPRLVHERRRLQCVVPALARKVSAGDAAQLAVNDRNSSAGGAGRFMVRPIACSASCSDGCVPARASLQRAAARGSRRFHRSQKSVVGLARLSRRRPATRRARRRPVRERIQLRDRQPRRGDPGSTGTRRRPVGVASAAAGPGRAGRRARTRQTPRDRRASRVRGLRPRGSTRARPTALTAAMTGNETRLVSVASGNRLLELADERRRLRLSAPHSASTRPARSSVMLSRLDSSPSATSFARLRALSDDRVVLRVFDRQLRGHLLESALKRHLDAVAELLVRGRHRARRTPTRAPASRTPHSSRRARPMTPDARAHRRRVALRRTRADTTMPVRADEIELAGHAFLEGRARLVVAVERHERTREVGDTAAVNFGSSRIASRNGSTARSYWPRRISTPRRGC